VVYCEAHKHNIENVTSTPSQQQIKKSHLLTNDKKPTLRGPVILACFSRILNKLSIANVKNSTRFQSYCIP